jgi:hypothetical protein
LSDSSPLSVLLTDLLPGELAQGIEKEAVKVEALPVLRLLDDLPTPPTETDPNELIMQRFLYRGAVCLVLGPTGVGKSSFLMQLAIHFAVGQPLFGITPGTAYRERGLRVLLIQAENDDGDLAEMRDGVLAGCQLNDVQKVQAQKRVMVCTVNDRSSDRFALTLDALLTEHGPFDVVIVDPAFAYLGGDSNSQKDVSRFMRELLNPLLQRHKVGLILAHHTNKPLRGKEKDNWEAGDFAYLGAGSAEWINPARAALAIRSIGSDSVFELRAPKRGKRLGWRDGDGQPVFVRYIAHHREAGVICWRDAEPAEVEELMAEPKRGRPPSCHPVEVLHGIRAKEGQNQAYYKRTLAAAIGCDPSSVQRTLAQVVKEGWIRFTEVGQEKRYHLTEKGRAKAQESPTAAGDTDSPLESPE